jgi:hypothetical protein
VFEGGYPRLHTIRVSFTDFDITIKKEYVTFE